jgi:hypothetical protein
MGVRKVWIKLLVCQLSLEMAVRRVGSLLRMWVRKQRIRQQTTTGKDTADWEDNACYSELYNVRISDNAIVTCNCDLKCLTNPITNANLVCSHNLSCDSTCIFIAIVLAISIGINMGLFSISVSVFCLRFQYYFCSAKLNVLNIQYFTSIK